MQSTAPKNQNIVDVGSASISMGNSCIGIYINKDLTPKIRRCQRLFCDNNTVPMERRRGSVPASVLTGQIYYGHRC
jgi:hypothetical protein